MKKSVLVLVLIIVLSISLVSALNSTETDDKAIECLKDKLGDDCADLNSVEQIAFSMLAMSHDSNIKSDCKSPLMDKSNDDECWPWRFQDDWRGPGS